MTKRLERNLRRSTKGRSDLWLLLFITIMLVAATVIMTLKLLDQSEKHVDAIRNVKVRSAISNNFGLKSTETDLQIKEDLRLHPARTEAKYQQVEVSEVGMKYIAKMTNLHELDLSGSPIKDGWVKHLVKLPLVNLNLEDSDIHNTGLEKLATIKTLQVLNLTATKVSDDGVEKLAALPDLRHVILSETNVTNRGIRALTACPKLDSLQIAATPVTSEVLRDIAKMPALGFLDASMNKLRAPDVAALAQLKYLNSIKFKRCDLNDDSLEAIATYPMLQVLELQGNPFGPKGLMSLGRLKTLGLLYLDGCKNLTETDVNRFKAKHPRCTVNYHADGGTPLENLDKLKLKF